MRRAFSAAHHMKPGVISADHLPIDPLRRPPSHPVIHCSSQSVRVSARRPWEEQLTRKSSRPVLQRLQPRTRLLWKPRLGLFLRPWHLQPSATLSRSTRLSTRSTPPRLYRISPCRKRNPHGCAEHPAPRRFANLARHRLQTRPRCLICCRLDCRHAATARRLSVRCPSRRWLGLSPDPTLRPLQPPVRRVGADWVKGKGESPIRPWVPLLFLHETT